MLGDSFVAGSLGAADYVVFALMLVVSAAVGFYFAWTSRVSGNSGEFLTGGRSLTAVPVALSLTANFMSSITVLSNPAEVYLFGAQLILFSVSYVLSTLVASEVFLPVSYRLSITSAYEYLELRFNRATRLIVTVLFITQAILYCGVVIYGPALALSQVTGLNLWGGIISTGAVCTLYCTLGGLKAVVWTDVFQIGIMLAGYLAVIIQTVILQGGVSTIISDSKQGGRLNFWDFDINPMRRHTFWTITVGGTVSWLVIYGTNQAQIQRYISCKSITHARVALFINGLGLCTFLVASVFAGLCLYSVFKDCDPWTTGHISTPDQLIPYLVMGTLTSLHGLPGLFLAAVYSGALSTVSSSINALAAVTVEDLIKPHITVSEKKLLWVSKGLSLIYGALCISLAGLASIMGGMLQTAATVGGVCLGPALGVFTLGIFFPFANSKGGLSGLLSGLVASVCLGIGAGIYPSPPSMTRPLPLSTEGCNVTTTESFNWTSTILPTEPSIFSTTAPNGDNISIFLSANGTSFVGPVTQAFTRWTETKEFNSIKTYAKMAAFLLDQHPPEESWLSPSYLYISLIGTVIAIIVGLIISLLTGGLKERADPGLMLMKEDTITYHVYKYFLDRVIRRKKEAYPMADLKEKVGNINSAFWDTSIDLKS